VIFLPGIREVRSVRSPHAIPAPRTYPASASTGQDSCRRPAKVIVVNQIDLNLTLHPCPKLVYRHWGKPGDAKGRTDHDVTARADEFLFERVQLADGLTVADVFRLFDACPALQRIYRREFAAELVEEARKGPVSQAGSDDPDEHSQLEYLELSYGWGLNTHTAEYSSVHQLDLDGVGKVLAADAPGDGKKAGERVRYSVSLTPLRELLNLPLRVSEEHSICEDDLDAMAYGDVIQRGRCAEVTLGQVLHSLLSELSWHGGPAEQAEVLGDLTERLEEVRAGTVELVDGDDVFDRILGRSRGYEVLFESLGGTPLSEVRHAMRQVGDDEAAGPWFDEHFDGRVALKPEFAPLGGRALRRAFREQITEELRSAVQSDRESRES
jgi:hypothetical protein